MTERARSSLIRVAIAEKSAKGSLRSRPASGSSARLNLLARKKGAFAAFFCLAILGVVEAVLWGCGVKTGYHHRDPNAEFTPQVPHFQVQ
jgi:hypothetical protein